MTEQGFRFEFAVNPRGTMVDALLDEFAEAFFAGRDADDQVAIESFAERLIEPG